MWRISMRATRALFRISIFALCALSAHRPTSGWPLLTLAPATPKCPKKSL